jgi:hypothetical protein
VTVISLTIFSTVLYSHMIATKFKSDGETVKDGKTVMSVAQKLVSSFALQANYKSITSAETTRSLPSIDGFRLFCTIWVVLGHVYYYSLASIDNIKLNFVYGNAWLLQPIYSAVLAVDVFFVIGGFLQAYNFCEDQKRNPKRNDGLVIVNKILKRYLQTNVGFAIVRICTFDFKAIHTFVLLSRFSYWLLLWQCS